MPVAGERQVTGENGKESFRRKSAAGLGATGYRRSVPEVDRIVKTINRLNKDTAGFQNKVGLRD